MEALLFIFKILVQKQPLRNILRHILGYIKRQRHTCPYRQWSCTILTLIIFGFFLVAEQESNTFLFLVKILS